MGVAPASNLILCSINHFGGKPFGRSSGNTSEYSCNIAVVDSVSIEVVVEVAFRLLNSIVFVPFFLRTKSR